jgi:PilZ domain
VSEESASSLIGSTAVSGIERRRSQRVVIRMAVTIHLTAPGKASALKAHTLDVNAHGALLLSPHSFTIGAHFTLENNQTKERQLCRVARAPQATAEGYQVAVEFEKPSPNFWRISFPPPNWKPLEG